MNYQQTSMKKGVLLIFIIIIGLTNCNQQTPNNMNTTTNNMPNVVLSGDELKIVAEINLKPDAWKAMKPVFEKVIAGSQAEEGCIYYDLHQDVSDTTNTKYVMVEIWKNQEAIDFHNETQHFKTFKQASEDYIDSMRVTILKIAK